MRQPLLFATYYTPSAEFFTFETMLLRIKVYVMTALLAVHLCFVLSTPIFHRFPQLQQRLGIWLTTYDYYTGCSTYRFFAPDVARQAIAKCTLTDSNGSVSRSVIGYANTGTQFRMSNLIQYLNIEEGPETAARVAADYCTRTHSGIKQVVVTIGRVKYQKPDLYEVGDSLLITPLYQATFDNE